jgi:hypothetical protein
LCGLFETGSKFFKLKESGHVLTIKLSNKQVSKEIQQLLLCYGITCRRISHCIALKGNDLRDLVSFIGEKETPRFEEAKKLLKSKTYSPEESRKKNIFFDGVRNVKPIGELPTYDLRVPAENNYVLNGFVSHNSGDKIRGYRFNLLVIDELLLLSEKVINEVLLPFMAIQINPRERQKVREAEGELIRLGLMQPEDATVFPNNKLIGLTSASYEFEYLYEMFKDYKNLIYDQEADNVSHAIMQLSCEMAPPGLYDESNYPADNQELWSKYKVNFNVLPIPTSNDFRITQISQEDLDKMKAQVESGMIETQRGIARELFGRLYKVVESANVAFKDPEVGFNQSKIDNIGEVIEVLRRLNVDDDPKLERLCKIAEERVCTLDAKDLKKDINERKQAAATTAKLLDMMADYN